MAVGVVMGGCGVWPPFVDTIKLVQPQLLTILAVIYLFTYLFIFCNKIPQQTDLSAEFNTSVTASVHLSS